MTKNPLSEAKPDSKGLACSASMAFSFPSQKAANDAKGALLQETEYKKRSASTIKCTGSTLTVAIEADDIVSLRATINSYLRLLSIVEGIETKEINLE